MYTELKAHGAWWWDYPASTLPTAVWMGAQANFALRHKAYPASVCAALAGSLQMDRRGALTSRSPAPRPVGQGKPEATVFSTAQVSALDGILNPEKIYVIVFTSRAASIDACFFVSLCINIHGKHIQTLQGDSSGWQDPWWRLSIRCGTSVWKNLGNSWFSQGLTRRETQMSLRKSCELFIAMVFVAFRWGKMEYSYVYFYINIFVNM